MDYYVLHFTFHFGQLFFLVLCYGEDDDDDEVRFFPARHLFHINPILKLQSFETILSFVLSLDYTLKLAC